MRKDLNNGLFGLSFRVLLPLVFLFILSSCTAGSYSTEDLPLPTQPTLPIQSTITSKPTIQPTPTPLTKILPVPTPITGQNYGLTEWTVEKAESLIRQVKYFPETLDPQQRGYLDSGYYVAFKYAGLAELENGRRFSQLEDEKSWLWDGAYDLYSSNNKETGAIYAWLVADALNKNETDLQNLGTWLSKRTPFSVSISPVTPPEGYQNSVVIFIKRDSRDDNAGGFAIWIVYKDNYYFGYPLKNNSENVFGSGDSFFELVQINEDGIPETIIQNVDWMSFGLHYGDLRIYSLDQVPPREIIFDVPPHNLDIATWSVIQNQPDPAISFLSPISVMSDDGCYSFVIDWQYRWQSDQLKLYQVVPPSMEVMEKNPVCTRLLADALDSPGFLRIPSVLAVYKKLLDLPFINSDPDINEIQFSADKSRLSLAIYLSDLGDELGANEQIKKIEASNDPFTVDWRKNALTFYKVRKDSQALFEFCRVSKVCDLFLDRSEVIATIPPNKFSEVENILSEMGVDFQSSGTYDFDQDGEIEKWLFFNSSDSCSLSHIWILARNETRINSRIVSYLCVDGENVDFETLTIEPKALIGNLPSYQIAIGGKEMLTDPFLYWPMGQDDPTIDYRQAGDLIDAVQTELLIGKLSPTVAREKLFDIQKKPIEPSYWSDDLNARLLYLIGLSYELEGKNDQAVQRYLELWKTYPNNPYAYMAMTKIEPIK